MNVLALCAGIGGLELGLRRACPAARVVCCVEHEAYAAAVLAARMEDESLDPCPVWSDLRTFDGRPWRGVVDLVAGGYPCQPFSVAGKRQGEDDPRHLWPHVARVLAETGAPLAFFENVPGHLRIGFSGVLGDLAALGFDAEWMCCGAPGVPHRRQRLFVLAHARRERAQIPAPRRFAAEPVPGGDGASRGTSRAPEWPPSSRLVRDVHGVPARVDRVRALGNAVVPAQAALAWNELTRRITR